MDNIPLTLISSHGGCAAKLGPRELRNILGGLELPDDSSRMVIENLEDAGIISINNSGVKIIQSIDVITPVSDDPWKLGAISVAHALSDLYAKGAEPVCGLVFLGVPLFQVSTNTATKILQGAIDKLSEAGAILLGGHTINSKELQVGLSVTGTVENPITNIGCKEGDALILTKPIGNGVIVTALKLNNGGISINDFNYKIVEQCDQNMLNLNSAASRIMTNIGIHSCTDITGFGLIGHLMEMLHKSNLSAVIYMHSIPVLSGVDKFLNQNITSSVGEQNAAFWWDECQYLGEIDYQQKMILFDPQTSGGLLISVAPEKANFLIENLIFAGVRTASIIGYVTTRKDTSVIISP